MFLPDRFAGDSFQEAPPWPLRTPARADADIAALAAEARELRATEPSRAVLLHWCQRAHDRLVAAVGDGADAVAAWQQRLLPLFLTSPFLDRAYRQPRGYAGDYATIQMMYDAVPAGSDAFARAVDAWALQQPCPRAVRNRRARVHGLLAELGPRFQGQELSVVSLGCGPAAEVFECLPADGVVFRLLDIDEEAVAHVSRRAQAVGAADRVKPLRANVIKLALGRSTVLPAQQHAFYSLGLIDYFGDELVVRLLDWIHRNLAEGGAVVLGNFRPGHPNAAFFDHALDWPLRLRSAEHLHDLVQRSRFRGGPVAVGAEAEGVQLFVTCLKA